MDSPVSGDMSADDDPPITTPSTGIFSPGRTATTSPLRTFSGEIISSPPPRRTRADDGFAEASDFMERRAREAASSWKNSPVL